MSSQVRFLPVEVGKQAVVEEWNDCTAPWGAYRWALDRYDAPTYKHYVLMTSAVQGPMLPKYFPVGIDDTRVARPCC